MRQTTFLLVLFVIIVAATILTLTNKISKEILIMIFAFILGAILGYFPNAKNRIR